MLLGLEVWGFRKKGLSDARATIADIDGDSVGRVDVKDDVGDDDDVEGEIFLRETAVTSVPL